MKLKYEILSTSQQKLFEILKKEEWISNYYLAGGTALALILGHRKSFDFDFFSNTDFSIDFLSEKLSKIGNFLKLSEQKNTLHCIVNNVKISFLGYKYPLLESPIVEGNIKIANIKDIACMKLSAIISRGTKKDFVDLYFILQTYSLEELFQFYSKKYNQSNYEYVLLKSLVYFSDAEEDPMPKMLKKVDWEEVKKEIINKVNKISII
ncbi:MAG: nucleotidyl transferase AbiEii/AbiGii toxin family protein [Candidatus Altarchaeaceae archaeon]